MAPETGENLKDLASLRIDRDAMAERRAGGRWVRWLVLVAVILLAGWGGLEIWRRVLEPLRTPVVSVAAATVRGGDKPGALLTASGYVVAQRQAQVAPKIAGRLIELKVVEGTHVRAGEIIGRLESRDIAANLEDSRRALDVARAEHAEALARESEARREHERQQRLLSDGVTSQSDFDAAEARWKVAAAQVDSTSASIPKAEAAVTVAEVLLENTLIRAPFDGVVTTKNAEIGEIVAPVSVGGPASGNSIFVVADMDSLEAEVDINESNISRVKEGQPAEIVLDAFPDRRYPGALRQIVPTANRQKATIEGKVAFLEKGPEVLPEMSARVTFLESEKPAGTPVRPRVYAPKNVIVVKDGRDCVLVVRDSRVRVVPVQVGPEVEGRLEITTGLSGGEMLVLDPPSSLADGAKVRVEGDA